jgi:hypothetical protein
MKSTNKEVKFIGELNGDEGIGGKGKEGVTEMEARGKSSGGSIVMFIVGSV